MKQGLLKAAMLALMACWLVLTVVLLASEAGSVSVSHPTPLREAPPPLPPRNPADVFEIYMCTDITPAGGFDFPVGDPDGQGSHMDPASGKTYPAWYVSTRFAEWYKYGLHPGEDWNGVGGGNTDLGQPVHAIANGRVVHVQKRNASSCGLVVIQHVYYENHNKRRIRSVYRHLQGIRVKPGQAVKRRQTIGTLGKDPKGKFYAHLHFELRYNEKLSHNYWPSKHRKTEAWLRKHYAEPSAFIRGHRNLFVPQSEKHLILVDRRSNRMRLYQRGRIIGQYTVGVGNDPGRKRLRGDGKIPVGMYFVVDKQQLQLGLDMGKSYGGRWLYLNYPNKYDAIWGKARGLLAAHQEAEIAQAWRSRGPTPGDTPLGGGLSILGGVEDWARQEDPRPDWGCLVMQNQELAKIYRRVAEGAMVVIF